MPMFIRKFLHSLILVLSKIVVKFSPGARHMLYAGAGSSAQLCGHILRSGVKRVLVVTDKPLRELGIVDKAISQLGGDDVEVVIFDEVLPDPTFEQVAAGVAVMVIFFIFRIAMVYVEMLNGAAADALG